jgi:hypothetical protein
VRYLQLDRDAPPVPNGVRPRIGVDYGCGAKDCRACYEVIPPHHLRTADFVPDVRTRAEERDRSDDDDAEPRDDEIGDGL